jgi:anti-sigma factor RsiW
MNSYCKKIRPLLSEYVDGALDSGRAADVARHLPDCSECSNLLEDFRANKARLSSMPLRQTSTGFDAALAQRIAAINQQRTQRSWLAGLAEAFKPSRTNIWRPAVASIAAVGIVIGSVMWSSVTPTHPPQPNADPALIQQCIAQHRNYSESQPLTDLSAQTLADQLDNAQSDVEPDDDDTL